MIHQLVNACIALVVGTAALCNVHVPLLPYLGAWCIADGGIIVATQNSGARRNAVLIHHVITSICCFVSVYEGHLYDPNGVITRKPCLLELSTVFVCLNNAFPSLNLKHIRNIIFLLVRTTVSIGILSRIMSDYHVLTRHVALQVALVSLSLAWICGPNVVGRNASVICYYTPLAAAIKIKSTEHILFTLFGALGTFIFYEKNKYFLDRVIITAHILYVIHVSPFFAILHVFDGYVSRNINNVLVPYLVFTSRPTLDLLIGFLIMACYILSGGPKQYTYGHRILWHTASACVITECIKETHMLQ